VRHAADTAISVFATARRGLARRFQLEATAVGTRSSNQTVGVQDRTETPLLDTVFYTPDVVNAPGGIASGIRFLRDTLQDLARRPLRMERQEQLESIRLRDEDHQRAMFYKHGGVDRAFS
jgi:hypothetical protein